MLLAEPRLHCQQLYSHQLPQQLEEAAAGAVSEEPLSSLRAPILDASAVSAVLVAVAPLRCLMHLSREVQRLRGLYRQGPLLPVREQPELTGLRCCWELQWGGQKLQAVDV